ncbi:MAG: endolytic transglycosylase MltG [Clostridia bacterium]|nr:endolytic transglycosylase MltG [Clostridia bacterium]
MKKSIIIIIILVALIIAVLGPILYYNNMISPVSKNSEEVSFKIEQGTTSNGIGEILKQENLIKSEFIYKIYVKMNKVNNMQAGEYTLNKNMKLSEIVKILQEGPDKLQNTIDVTFLEGKNFRWIAKTIAEKTNNSEDSVFELLNDNEYIDTLIDKYWFITDEIKNKDIYYALEGYLFPDTYNFKNKDITVKEIFEAMLDQMEKKLEQYKDEIQKSGISMHRLLTVASIVELEASNAESRSTVASVFYNRVQKNMAMGSDVTTYYAIKVDMSERDLKQSELNKSNPYNTRGPNMEGKIPVGPICSVGIESINAALHPETTDYLYFVADKNGKVYFAKNVEEHNNNIKSLKQQGLWYTYE